MIDLKKISGLPIMFDEKKCSLIFGEHIDNVVPAIRTLQEMLPVLIDKQAKKPQEFYYMYRDVHLKKDIKFLRKNNLRYDITVIPSCKIKNEFNKTLGHYHPIKEKTNLSYTEVYEVLYGKAHYLLQMSVPDYEIIEDVILIETLPGEKVIIPPNYGHLTINPENTPLVMANWMADNLSSIYKPFEEKQGGAYFEIVKQGKVKFIPNKNYKNLPELRFLKPNYKKYFNPSPMYHQVIENLNKYKFILDPEKYYRNFSTYNFGKVRRCLLQKKKQII